MIRQELRALSNPRPVLPPETMATLLREISSFRWSLGLGTKLIPEKDIRENGEVRGCMSFEDAILDRAGQLLRMVRFR